MKDSTYFVLEYDDERAFKTYDDAYDTDCNSNPEYYGCEEWAFDRAESVIYEVSWDELNSYQRMSLSPDIQRMNDPENYYNEDEEC